MILIIIAIIFLNIVVEIIIMIIILILIDLIIVDWIDLIIVYLSLSWLLIAKIYIDIIIVLIIALTFYGLLLLLPSRGAIVYMNLSLRRRNLDNLMPRGYMMLKGKLIEGKPWICSW